VPSNTGTGMEGRLECFKVAGTLGRLSLVMARGRRGVPTTSFNYSDCLPKLTEHEPSTATYRFYDRQPPRTNPPRILLSELRSIISPVVCFLVFPLRLPGLCRSAVVMAGSLKLILLTNNAIKILQDTRYKNSIQNTKPKLP